MAKTPRTTKIALLATAVAMTTAACGGAATQGDEAAGDAVTIQMVAWPGPEGEAMQDVVAAYNTGQGTEDGIHVEMATLTRDDLFNKEAVEMSSKSSTFDIYYTSSYVLSQHAPHLSQLEDIDTSEYSDAAIQSFTTDGLRALPLDLSAQVLYYRTDLMDSLLTDPDAAALYGSISQEIVGTALEPKHPDEWTWDDYLATGAYFTQQYNPDSPTTHGTTLPMKTSPFQVMQWNGVLGSFGGSWVNSSGDFDIETQAAHDAIDLYATAYTQGIASPQSAQGDFPELQASMTSGNVAFIMQWASGYAALNDPEASPETAGRIGVSLLPGKGISHLHTQGVGINAYSDKQDAAKTFLTYLTTDEAMDIYAASGVPVALTSAMPASGTDPLFDVVATIANEGHAFEYPQFENLSGLQINTELAGLLVPAWLGSEPVDDALRAAQAAVTRMIDAS